MDAISRAACGLKRSLEVVWEGVTEGRGDGAPDRARTCSLQLRRLTLYPITPRAHGRRVIAHRRCPTRAAGLPRRAAGGPGAGRARKRASLRAGHHGRPLLTLTTASAILAPACSRLRVFGLG